MATQVSLNDGAVASAGALALQTNGTTQAVSISTGQVATLAQNPILTSGTANGVAYLNGSKVLTTGSALTWNGSNLAITGTLGTTSNVNVNSTGGTIGVYVGPSGSEASFVYNTDGNLYISPRSGFATSISGNVGIGTTSPGGLLQVGVPNTSTGSLRAYSGFVNIDAGYQSSNVSGTASTPSLIWSGDDNTGIWHPASDTLAISTAGSEAARIDSSGNLLVGTTSPSPGYTNTNTGAQISASGSMFSRAAADYVISVNQNTSDGGTYYQMVFRAANGAVGNITSTSSTTSYTSLSDYRLKNTIAPMTGALAKVAALKPVTYKWNSSNLNGDGFIAHELAEVCPQAVTGEKDAVDAEGNPKYQGIDTSFLVATLTAAIQELKAEFDAYKASHP